MAVLRTRVDRIENAYAFDLGERVSESCEVRAAPRQVLADAGQLDAAERGLDLAHAEVVAEHRHVVHPRDRALVVALVDAERAQPRDVRDDLLAA